MVNEILSENYTEKMRNDHLSVLNAEVMGFYIINALKDRILAMLDEAYEYGYEQGAADDQV